MTDIQITVNEQDPDEDAEPTDADSGVAEDAEEDAEPEEPEGEKK